MSPRATAESYLSYLDKEMSIMGILCAFCVLTVAGVANALKDVGSDTLASSIWEDSSFYIGTACACMMPAALFFYRQRSLLAWYYGQIALAQVPGQNGSLREWLSDADGWTTWRWYQAAFAVLLAGVLEFCAAIWSHVSHQERLSTVVLSVPLLAALAFSVTMWLVLRTYQEKQEPWLEFLAKFGIDLRDKEP
jgi:hypothetical protein